MEPADAGGEDRAEASGIDADRIDAAGLLECLGRGRDCELLDTVGAARLFRIVEVRGGIPVVDGDRLTVGDPGTEQATPERRAPDSGGGDDAETRDCDSTAAAGTARGDDVVGLLDRLDAFEFFLRYRHVEFLFERHHELDEVEAVGIEVVTEVGLGHDGALLDGQHLDGALAEAGKQFWVHGVLLVGGCCSVAHRTG